MDCKSIGVRRKAVVKLTAGEATKGNACGNVGEGREIGGDVRRGMLGQVGEKSA